MVNQIQIFGIVIYSAAEGSLIANNYTSNNEVNIGMFGTSGYCIIVEKIN